jgi:hypothetical protein
MDKIIIIEQPQIDGSTVEIVEIDNGNGSYTSMPKTIYDEQQAALNADKL